MAGHCYDDSFEYLLQNPDRTLVHGIVAGQGKLKGIRYGHAWIEHGDIVYDPSLDKRFPLVWYYAVGQIEYVVKYDFKEARTMILLEGTYGPWDKEISEAIHA